MVIVSLHNFLDYRWI